MRLADYIGGLTVPQGPGAGEPYRVLPWERRFLRGFERTSGDIAMSLARGNGKSGLVSAIACAVADPDGPLHGRAHEVAVVASSFSQARIIFEDCLSVLGDLNGLPAREWRVQDSANTATIQHRKSKARIRCIGSDPRRAHGLRPRLVLADEPAQWESSKADRMHAALRTSMGKIPGSRMIAIGTRPASSAHWFQKMLDGGCSFSLCYAAAKSDPPFHWRTVRKANPSLGIMPELAVRIRSEMADAKRDSALLPAFESLRLNMGTADITEALLLSPDVWASIETAAPECRGPFVLGVDLGATAAMSAAAAYWLETGALDAFALLPERPGLSERGRFDGVGTLYHDMARRGELLRAGEFVSDVPFLLSEALRRWGRPRAIACDRWREGELRQALTDASFPLAVLSLRGQGYRDGGEDLRQFRKACLGGHVRPGRSLLLRSAMGEARTVSDDARNEKLSKKTEGGRRAHARDDAAAAAIVAVAEGVRRGAGSAAAPSDGRRSWRYRGAA